MPRGQFKNPEERIKKIKLARARQIIIHSETTKRKIGETNKRLFKLGLKSVKGKKNPMYGKSNPWAGFQKGHPDLVPKESRKKQALKLKGEKCHFWKGGITPINHLIRQKREYREWRKKVFERDDYTCWICGNKSGNGHRVILESHHLKRFNDYPKLRLKISNGLTLCMICHKIYTEFGNPKTEFQKGSIPWNKKFYPVAVGI